MKTIIVFLLIIFNVFGLEKIQAQNYIKSSNEEEFESFQNKASTLNFLSSQNSSAIQNRSLVASNSGSIFIEQIGTGNTLVANTRSKINDFTFSQNGESNNIYLDINATTISQSITQIGNKNQFLNITTNLFGLHNAEVVQNGNNQDITLYGNNNLSNKIKIYMQGNDKSVIVRNFN
ncbi:MAG: hypothetical protein COZ75_05285 [Flavobacteriaceae bacterium CG_4_8_14_3_um_filter_34_10]|nr:hypothetical protein [Flavobacteriia bacterium]OIP49791.1 MAG: hypothetical protein AUK33_09480 [Flavobacteriaceae bacterium CG2_30_34_30]PIQ17977.1 MAG: hypothetical protein COW66_08885 [Flavobacteriaceae bacterium CG18_big_fil_WC_8_21_14_2_50_34_36]PIV49600.1 MAG: hypothetical protein COS19_07770 [Flavobacteriaceae bacterium CG02_land_8_20_14_3_00_34_13]PIX09725.1 MAG: hypothetical protein COZ75_05285 [Flavobacteriaceae bacterium CG_4_8_14_3_um_filter_34_10]PIZ08926.1 MAG: hypothetical pr